MLIKTTKISVKLKYFYISIMKNVQCTFVKKNYKKKYIFNHGVQYKACAQLVKQINNLSLCCEQLDLDWRPT